MANRHVGKRDAADGSTLPASTRHVGSRRPKRRLPRLVVRRDVDEDAEVKTTLVSPSALPERTAASRTTTALVSCAFQTLDDVIQKQDQKSLPVCLQRLVTPLDEKQKELFLASTQLSEAIRTVSPDISNEVFLRKAQESKKFQGQDLLRVVETNVHLIKKIRSQLEADSAKRKANYEKDVRDCDLANQALLEALQRAAKTSCAVLSDIKEAQDIRSFPQAGVWERLFGTGIGTLSFDEATKQCRYEKNTRLSAKRAPDFLRMIQGRIEEIIKQPLVESSLDGVDSRNKEVIERHRMRAHEQRETRTIEIMTAKEIFSTYLKPALAPLMQTGALQEQEVKESKAMPRVIALSVKSSAQIAKVKAYQDDSTVVEKGHVQAAHEAEADQLLEETNNLAKILNDAKTALSIEYAKAYELAIKDITALEVATTALAARYAEKELKPTALNDLYHTEKERKIPETAPDFAAPLQALKITFGSTFDVAAEVLSLQDQFNNAKESYKKQRRSAGLHLGDPDLSPRIPPRVLGLGRSRLSLLGKNARVPATVDTSENKSRRLHLMKGLLKYLEKVLSDTNMSHFWKYQATTFCCFGGHKIRLGSSRELLKVPTGVGRLKEQFRDNVILKSTLIDNFDQEQMNTISLGFHAILKQRLTLGKGRKEETTSLFLTQLNNVFECYSNANSTEDQLTATINIFKSHMFNLQDRNQHKLNLSNEAPRLEAALDSNHERASFLTV